jgi:hypothetical protein
LGWPDFGGVEELLVFFAGPFCFLDAGVEPLVPACFALLGCLCSEKRGDTSPLVHAILADSGLEDFVLCVLPHTALDDERHDDDGRAGKSRNRQGAAGERCVGLDRGGRAQGGETGESGSEHERKVMGCWACRRPRRGHSAELCTSGWTEKSADFKYLNIVVEDLVVSITTGCFRNIGVI